MREGSAYLAAIIRKYDAAAIKVFKAHAVFKSQGDDTTYNKLVESGQTILESLFQHSE